MSDLNTQLGNFFYNAGNKVLDVARSIPGLGDTPPLGSSYSSDADQQTPKLSANPAADWLKNKKGIVLSPQEQAELNLEMGRQAGEDNLNLQLKGAYQVAPLNNQIANANTQRSLVTNAQKYNADNVANQLRSLDNARNTSANAISSALATTASLFR